MLAPGSVRFDPDETWRINRVRIAERLHKFPHEIDALPKREVQDLIDVWAADDRLMRMKKGKR